ncbi:hypothetical protein EDL99_09895 [Ornithobacterium rhinotracheale]|uniref:hypothetical protein n=1 Tax=Ornithobacterium rhinotracheale TaxID=28251 RepID=UPI00129C9EDE|nr:hypothetical protein [Ornithobacterium rhinotracheale]MRJ09168.1 hypothetical protein [Ornithobacterium rhinotracheale]UOH77246.1 hypothetical protein MT996_08490 [Ornithobacterium rhinotracheale]
MTHRFVINDENIVNSYGYRVLTAGIDTKQYMRNPVVLYMHSRGFDKVNGTEGNEVIGRVVKLEKTGGQLIADVEFDTEDDFSKKIAGKVERGFLKMASIGADVIEASSNAEHILPGQIFETVTKSKLVELSIVDIGGNDNALKLHRNGEPIQLKKLKKQKDMTIKTIALALGMSEETNEQKVLQEVQALKLAKDNAEKRISELEQEKKENETAEATQLVDKAIALGVFPEALKQSQIKSFALNFVEQKETLTKLIAEKENEIKLNGKNQVVKTVVLGKGEKPKTGIALTFDYLQKHDVEQLREIKLNQPEEYARLAQDYARGVRHKEN